MPDEASKMDEAKPAFDRDSVKNTLTVAIGLSLVCSILVASTAILLKPVQELNEVRFQQRIILQIAGLLDDDADDNAIEQAMQDVEVRLVDLETGQYVEGIDAAAFDAKAAAIDPDTGVSIPDELDVGNIRRRAIYAQVYLVKDDDEIRQIILPVHGAGLWSTLYGYLALDPDGTTVSGLQFYSHAETPGLGDQIDDPAWRAQWVGKQVSDETGEPRIEVIRGFVNNEAADAMYQVDGLSGATLTGRGVSNLVRYWTGPHGFGPYLSKYRQAKGT